VELEKLTLIVKAMAVEITAIGQQIAELTDRVTRLEEQR
jgi:hypothetical protein